MVLKIRITIPAQPGRTRRAEQKPLAIDPCANSAAMAKQRLLLLGLSAGL
jgi:hypothetical protein